MKKNVKKQKNQGITLIALVITIIVLLILAGTVIYLGLEDDGLFKRAQDSTLIYGVERVKEEMEIVKGNVLIDNLGKLNKDDFFDGLIDEGIVESKDDIIDNGDNTYDVTTKEDYVFEIIIKDDGNIDIIYIGKKDEIGPRIRGFNIENKTSNSIEVVVKVDNAEGAEYTYLYKKASEGEYTEVKKGKDITTYKYEGLSQKEVYDIKVVIENSKGKDEREISVLTGEIDKGAIEVVGEPIWENGQAKIEVNTEEEGYKIEYQVNGTEGEWIEVGEDGIIGNLNDGDDIYLRLNDGVNQSDYTSVSIEDNKNPEISIGSMTSTSNSITVTVNAVDNETGLKETGTYIYYINGEKKIESESNSYTFNGLADGQNYTIKVEVIDKAGNKNEVEQSIETKEVPSGIVQGAVTFGNPVWSGSTASITVSTNTGYNLEYQVGGTTGTWTKVANGGSIGNLKYNQTVYVRLTDGVNSGDHASVSVKDTVQPTVSVKSSNVTYNSATLTVTATDAQSGIKNYQFFLGSTSKATQTGNTYNYTGLAENTSYTLKVRVTDNAGNAKEASTTIKTGVSNVAPKVASVAYSTKTTNSLTIKATATDANSSDKLTYELYTSTSQSSGFTKKATLSNQTPGKEVSLTATGLTQYTYYYYYVKVSDGKASAQSATQTRVRTYCPGNTSHCRGGERCSGGTECTPPRCTDGYYYDCPTCSGSGTVNGSRCSRCNGNGYLVHECSHHYAGPHYLECSHGETSPHTVPCEHGRTSSHTIDCRHGKANAHYYCAHSNNGVQHD